MNLIIVESPTKARTLSRFLGKDFLVEATLGHIKDLPKSQLGVDIKKNFAPDYQLIPKQEVVVNALVKKARKVKKIFLATDPDREGEAIASHTAEVLGKSQFSRIVFHEITKQAVFDALDHPGKINRSLVDAQIARRVLDRLVGYKLSPLLWKKIRRGLSAGRVQSVTVRLIIEREDEIKAFKPQEFWEIGCLLKTKNKSSQFTAFLVRIGAKKAEVKNKRQADGIVVDLKKAKYKIVDLKKQEVHKNPYPPFTTSTMTQAAARLFGWSARKTMSIAQRLYERGLITYHRTDSTNLAGIAISKARNFISKEYGDKYIPENVRIFKTKAKVAQEAHEAIRPTVIKRKEIKVKGKQKLEMQKLYGLIWKRFVACQMSTSIFDRTTIDVLAAKYLLRASGEILKFDGWRKVFGYKQEKEVIQLPEVMINDPLYLIKVLAEQKFTQPPARFTEASLIKTLENLGIGRPSTYAPTISTIQRRQYVEKVEGKFQPTPVGRAVNSFLVVNFPQVFDYQFTANMETNLDKVANGESVWRKVIADFYNPFAKKLERVEEKSKRVKIETEKLGRKCPQCRKTQPASRQGELVIRIGRFGKFISCSRFPECDYTEKYVEKIGMKCPQCKEKGLPVTKQGDVIVKKTKKGRAFFGCSRYPECDWASWTDPKKKS
jgi:DNA topoisomerase-1